jgi:hypothetical protein
MAVNTDNLFSEASQASGGNCLLVKQYFTKPVGKGTGVRVFPAVYFLYSILFLHLFVCLLLPLFFHLFVFSFLLSSYLSLFPVFTSSFHSLFMSVFLCSLFL